MDLADVWGVYLTSADAAGTLAAAVALGATTRFEPSPVADLGIQALLDDPSGARVGIWQPGMFAGFGPIGTGRPGTPAWFQLHATDYAGSVSFYRDAFGWTPQVMSDTDDFRLTAIMDGEAGAPGHPGQPVAGIMDANAHLAAGEGVHWEIYLSVDDADKTLATVSELGGTIIREAADTPFGRFGDVGDPMGAIFNVIGRIG
jgi:predicted enzyme related to lactoylglutathione lyase